MKTPWLCAALLLGSADLQARTLALDSAAPAPKALAAEDEQSPSGKTGPNTDTPPDESKWVGDWRGTSLVVARNSAAKDETVVWHISKGSAPGKLSVAADKIVNGRVIPMGRLEFVFDRVTQTIKSEIKPGVWRLTLAGNKLEGTLTGHDQAVFRRVSLTKAR